MATILSNTRNFAATQNAYLKQSLSEYSNFLNSLPLLVHYYSKDHLNSTHDVNLRTVQEILGDDSPVKFNRILDFPLYKATNLEADPDDSDDVGTEAEVTGTAIVPPQSVQPREDDLFTIPWFGHKSAVFRVNKVNRSNIKGHTFWQISYYLYTVYSETGDLDKQVSRDYRVVGSPSSVTKSAIIAVDKAELCFKIQNKIELLIDDLTEFYDRRTDCYMMEWMGGSYLRWDEIVQHFVCKHNVYARSVPYRNETQPLTIDIHEFKGMYDLYKGTIYWAIDNCNYYHMKPYKGVYMSGPFAEEVPGRHLRDVVVRGTKYGSADCCGNCAFGYTEVFGNLWEYIRDITDVEVPSIPEAANYFRLIKFWMNEPKLEDVEQYIGLINPRASIYDYYYLPIAIYIFHDIINRIRTIYDFNN